MFSWLFLLLMMLLLLWRPEALQALVQGLKECIHLRGLVGPLDAHDQLVPFSLVGVVAREPTIPVKRANVRVQHKSTALIS